MSRPSNAAHQYVLATGDEGEERLALVEEAHGSDTERLLKRAGVSHGMRVADIGCGSGSVSLKLARFVGSRGTVVGVDLSPEQLTVARRRAERERLGNMRFVAASAYSTGLRHESFDAVYARFLLMHIARPADALKEMVALLRKGGILIVEDGDFASPYSSPDSPAYTRLFELYRMAVSHSGADPTIGPKLVRMVLDAGMPNCGVMVVQRILKDGKAKSLPEGTLLEAAPTLIEAGLCTEEEITSVVEEVRRLAKDPYTQFAMAQMTQVWAVKP